MSSEDFTILMRGILKGCVSIWKPSTWRWMKNAIDEYPGMTYADMVGVVFFGDYRRKKHFDRQDREDW
jgi:hypothetical protein